MTLNDTFIKKVSYAGTPSGEKHSDGGGLYLHVTQAGKYWRLAYRFLGKQKTLAIGVYPAVSLAKARKQREKAREQLAEGLDLSEAKKADRALKVTAYENTFKAVAMDWHSKRAKETSPGTTLKRLAHLETHIFPHLGSLPIANIKPLQVLSMLKAVAGTGAVYTSTRMREICGQVFRLAIQKDMATHDPSSSMRGAIEKKAVKHRPALTTRREFGEFVRDLRDTDRAEPLTRLCARLGLLTWTRPGELRYALWNEFDLEAAEWRIPAERMKTGKQLQAHTVPLSAEALALLPLLHELSGHTDRLFPSNGNAGGVISENTVNGLFRRMGYQDKQSHHGLRASARSLLSERGWTMEALERQLDHKEANKSIAAYARSQHLVERKRFMADWGALVSTLEAGDNVVAFPAKAA